MALLVFLLLLVASYLLPSSSFHHNVLRNGREVIHVDHGLDGVVWVVQLSDLHVSSYYPDRALSLQRFMGPLLKLINPSLVLITGDLTDAKSKDRRSKRQDETEWIEYKKTMEKVIADSGIPSYAFYDIRGNHDKFGVPKVGASFDYFSKYSISSLRNRTSSIQSVTLMNRGWKHLFLGIDTSMEVGLKGPCNLFGHPTDEQLSKIDAELNQWDGPDVEKVTKMAFGHFPMSFTASTEKGKRLESILAKHSTSAYVCGHLHAVFGRNLVKHHVYAPTASSLRSEFWEWEMGDWRSCRIMRIIAIDQGHISYSDFDISSFVGSHSREDDHQQLPTFVIPTYPLDSQKMEYLNTRISSSSTLNAVRVLIISKFPPLSVTVKFFDTLTDTSIPLEELDMHVLYKGGETSYMYVSEWNSSKYIDQSGRRYVYEVLVVDSLGAQTRSSLRPFSVNRQISKLKKTWREFFVMDIVFEQALIILLWTAFVILGVLFVFPRLIFHFLEARNYNDWVFSLFRQKLTARRAVQMILWFFIQGCSNNIVWWGQLVAIIWMIFLPWYWGEVLPEGFPVGSMSLWGWTVHFGDQSRQYGLGWPDLMVVVVPYLYFVVIPLYTLIFALSAEATIHRFHLLNAPEYKKKKQYEDDNGESRKLSSSLDSASSTETYPANESGKYTKNNFSILKCESSWIRMILLTLCMLILFIHYRQVYDLAGAYGVTAVLASPGFAWPVPVLMTGAILQFSACRKHS